MSKTFVQYPEGHVLLRNLSKKLPLISQGKGIHLTDKSGKEYFDAAGGALVMSLGHGREEIVHAISKQLLEVAYVNGTQFTSPVMEAFADQLAKLAAPLSLSRVMLLASGSEAVEAAFKLCRQIWVDRGEATRAKFIARVPSYHGNTLFALSASGRPHYKKFYGPMMSEVLTVSAPYEYRSPVTDYQLDGADFYANELEKLILSEGPSSIAGFIFEPVIGSSAGAALPPKGYYDRIQSVCSRYGILMIADEILCGSGRTGKFFASEHYGIKPDVLLLGKGINSGYVPVSVLLTKEEHVDLMKSKTGYFMHAQTYLQAPCMAAAAKACLDYYEKHSVLENATKVGEYLQKKLHEEILPHPHVGFVSGIGMLAGVEFVEQKATKRPFSRGQKTVEGFVTKAFENGITLWPNVGQADGINGDLVMIGPPLNSTREEIDEVVKRFKETLTDFFG